MLVSFIYGENSSDLNLEKAHIYPNPVIEDHFTVEAQKTIQSIEILNILGQQVQKEDNFSDTKVKVELNDNEHGIYLVKIVYKDKTEYVERVFIK